MKTKIFATAICFAVVLAGCDLFGGDEDDWVPPTPTTLRIRNESSHWLTFVSWGGEMIWDDLGPGSTGILNVMPGSGFIRFWGAGGTLHLRTEALVSLERGEEREFVIINSTVVVTDYNISNSLDTTIRQHWGN